MSAGGGTTHTAILYIALEYGEDSRREGEMGNWVLGLEIAEEETRKRNKF